MSDKKGSGEISLALVWNEIKHWGEKLDGIRASLDNLPCDDLSERVVRLEERMKIREVEGAKHEEGIQGAYDLVREKDKESFGRWWKIGIIFLAAVMSVVTGVLVFRLTRG